MLFIIYGDIESLIWKIDNCKKNPEKSSTTEIGKQIPSGYSMSTIWEFDHIEKKHSFISEKIYEKVLWIFKRKCKKYNLFWKEKNVAVDKK